MRENEDLEEIDSFSDWEIEQKGNFKNNSYKKYDNRGKELTYALY